MIDKKTAQLFDEAYKKIEIIFNSLANTKSDIEYLRLMNPDTNKYQELCFKTIVEDLDSMAGFIKAFEFTLKNQNKFNNEPVLREDPFE